MFFLLTRHADTYDYYDTPKPQSVRFTIYKHAFDNGGMEYRQTDGKTRRVHKQYVDVVARILAGGQVVPVTVCWVDGRCFTIDEIVSTTGFGLTVHGISTATYKVRFGGHATELYLEDQTRERPDGSQAHLMRWWVWAFDRTLEGERRR